MKQQLIEERNEIGIRIGKLKAFIDSGEFKSLCGVACLSIIDQLYHMNQYFKILNERIG